MDLHALTRRIEAEWRAAAGFTLRVRGGSDSNTYSSLEALERLAHARDVEAREGLRSLERWIKGARMLLGDAERPRRIPGAEKCPWCGVRSLRMWTGQGTVRCVNPSCATPSGEKATATFDYSAAAGLRLTWQDGSSLQYPSSAD
jgi:hypothetical protein